MVLPLESMSASALGQAGLRLTLHPAVLHWYGLLELVVPPTGATVIGMLNASTKLTS